MTLMTQQEYLSFFLTQEPVSLYILQNIKQIFPNKVHG